MKTFYYIIILLALATTEVYIAHSQQPPLFYLGGYASYNYNYHIANFNQLGTYPNCCPTFENGTGNGYSFGILSIFELHPTTELEIRGGITSLNADLTKNEVIGNTRVKEKNPPYDIKILEAGVRYVLSAKLFGMSLEPIINFKIVKNLKASVGFKAVYLFTSKFDQREELVAPPDVTFIDDRTIRNDYYDIDIPEAKRTQLMGTFGVGYEFQVGKFSYIIPEFKYTLPFTNISSVSWKPSVFQFGVSLKLPFMRPQKLPIEKEIFYERDTNVIAVLGLKTENIKLLSQTQKTERTEYADVIVETTTIYEKYIKEIPKPARIESSLEAIGIANDGTRTPNPTMIIEEIEMEQGFPLLPYVFFKTESSNLTQTSMKLLNKTQAQNFVEDSLEWNTIEIYSNLLNIIGKRLENNPKANLIVTGCNSNVGPEKGNLELSEARANAVKDYLTNTFNIDPKRIIIRKQNLPDIPTNINIPEGMEENQRVEISSNDYNIIKPLELKEIIKTSSPPIIEINPKIEAELPLKDWSIQIEQNKKIIRSFSGNGSPQKLIWSVEEEPMPEFETPINITLTAKDSIDQQTTAKTSLAITQRTIKKKRFEEKQDKRIEKYSLIVFDFDKANITPSQIKILESIKSRIKPNSIVTILGYTDRIGDPTYNKDLAYRRCLETQKFLKVPESNLIIKAVGSDFLLYDNDLPQGRSYSRTVQIIIETPINE